MADSDETNRLLTEDTGITSEVKQEEQGRGAQESDAQGATAKKSQGRSNSRHLPAIAAAVAAVTVLLVGVFFWWASDHGDWCNEGYQESAATWYGTLAPFALVAAGLGAGLGALSALMQRRLAKGKSSGSAAFGCGCAAALAAIVAGVVLGIAFVSFDIFPGC